MATYNRKESQNQVLTLKQISQKFDISLSKLYQAIAKKEFSFYKFSRKKIYVEEAIILKWLKQNFVEAAQKTKP